MNPLLWHVVASVNCGRHSAPKTAVVHALWSTALELSARSLKAMLDLHSDLHMAGAPVTRGPCVSVR